MACKLSCQQERVGSPGYGQAQAQPGAQVYLAGRGNTGMLSEWEPRSTWQVDLGSMTRQRPKSTCLEEAAPKDSQNRRSTWQVDLTPSLGKSPGLPSSNLQPPILKLSQEPKTTHLVVLDSGVKAVLMPPPQHLICPFYEKCNMLITILDQHWGDLSSNAHSIPP